MTERNNNVLVLVVHNPGAPDTAHLDHLKVSDRLTEPVPCLPWGEGDYDWPAISEDTVWSIFLTYPDKLIIKDGKTIMTEGLLEFFGSREGAFRFLDRHRTSSTDSIGWQYQYATGTADQSAGCRSVQRAGQGSVQSGGRNCIQRAAAYSIQQAGVASMQVCAPNCFQMAGQGSVQVCHWTDREGKPHVRSRVVGAAEADRWYRTSNGNWLVATTIEVIAVEHKLRDLTKKGGCKCK